MLYFFFFDFEPKKDLYRNPIYIYTIEIKNKKIKAANTTETAHFTNFRAIFNYVIYFFISHL